MKIQNYDKELTQRTYMFHGSFVILDVAHIANIMQRTAWNKYFFNEKDSVSLTEYLRNLKDGL